MFGIDYKSNFSDKVLLISETYVKHMSSRYVQIWISQGSLVALATRHFAGKFSVKPQEPSDEPTTLRGGLLGRELVGGLEHGFYFSIIFGNNHSNGLS